MLNLFLSAKEKFAELQLFLSKRSNITVQKIRFLPLWAVCLILAVLLTGYYVDPPAGLWARSIDPDIHAAFSAVTEFGKSTWYLVIVGVVLLGSLIWRMKRHPGRTLSAALTHIQLTLLFVFVTIAGSGLIATTLKPLFGRARPRYFEELGTIHFEWFRFGSGYASFPSGHSTTFGALAVLAILLVPKFRFFILALFGLLAFSRVAVGAHYPSDVLVGFTIGLAFSWWLTTVFARNRLVICVRNGHMEFSGRTFGCCLRVIRAMKKSSRNMESVMIPNDVVDKK
ncbi:MAG: phosphatase PAP2 family protein [Cohaesibacteraceae bacterium]|nr:phosphatase PAP2 family protein [Cohaesibacteraceae bacterium]MBL4877184.1 phosphatase PAP2 family protein [Cohaesibacteraceae bacterium]